MQEGRQHCVVSCTITFDFAQYNIAFELEIIAFAFAQYNIDFAQYDLDAALCARRAAALCGELQNCHLVISASVTTPTPPRPPKIILFVFCFLVPTFTVILSLLLLAIFMLLLVLVTNHFPDLHPNHDLHVYSISCFYCVF